MADRRCAVGVIVFLKAQLVPTARRKKANPDNGSTRAQSNIVLTRKVLLTYWSLPQAAKYTSTNAIYEISEFIQHNEFRDSCLHEPRSFAICHY
ncbi:hypothetical protein EV356DRAFT_502854 [Viridothelium virens]|uniref:Uncharacterized protein n=1 Tax=Viridothelium virens TaxID=1048519 RepID=A0A6A6H8C5_VIRVR|nr:hypothetical protein EV356DRAFT_502854 [Viridothelium virens]